MTPYFVFFAVAAGAGVFAAGAGAGFTAFLTTACLTAVFFLSASF